MTHAIGWDGKVRMNRIASTKKSGSADAGAVRDDPASCGPEFPSAAPSGGAGLRP
jgi:hypothetical protein